MVVFQAGRAGWAWEPALVRSDGMSLRALSRNRFLRGHTGLKAERALGPDRSLEGWWQWCIAGGCLKQEEVEPMYGKGKGRRNQGCSPLPGLGLFPTEEPGRVPFLKWGSSPTEGPGRLGSHQREMWWGCLGCRGTLQRAEGAQGQTESPGGQGARGGSAGQGSKGRGSLSRRGEGKPGGS